MKKKRAKAKSKVKAKRHQAVLVAFDAGGKRVKRQVLDIHDYYDGLNEIIDSSAYRARHRIRLVHGELQDDQGVIYQRFDNSYSARGKMVHSKVVHADGAMHEESYQ